jgi:transcriptional regulator with XRE-family HTH domain
MNLPMMTIKQADKSEDNIPLSDKECQRFAEVVKDLRSGRSLRPFAKIVGVSHISITKWENCEARPNHQNLKRIAELRNETTEQLLEYLKSADPVSSHQRLIAAILGSSGKQLAEILRAIAIRVETL